MKIRFSQQTIYRLVNCALREDTKFNDIDLTFEYAVVALRFLKNNIPEDVAQHLHSKLNGKFVLAAYYGFSVAATRLLAMEKSPVRLRYPAP